MGVKMSKWSSMYGGRRKRHFSVGFHNSSVDDESKNLFLVLMDVEGCRESKHIEMTATHREHYWCEFYTFLPELNVGV